MQLRTPTFFLHYNPAHNFQNLHGVTPTESYHKNETSGFSMLLHVRSDLMKMYTSQLNK